MNAEEAIDRKRIFEILILSSTPYYFYEQMLQNENIRSLSNHNSTDELIQMFKRFSQRITPSNLIYIYAIIFALTYKNPEEVRQFFEKLETTKIRWSRHISHIYFSNVKPIVYSSYHVQDLSMETTDTRSANSTSVERKDEIKTKRNSKK